MDGLLIIDKPEDLTSHDIVARVRRVLRTKRVGHTGTLDPFATGVMVLLIGKATRLAQFLDKDEKEYEAVVRLGFETDTGDRTGVRTAEYGMRDEDIAELMDKTDWEAVLSRFRGEIGQVPPMYSAKKIQGKKLYEFARRGVEIERKSVPVKIRALDLLDRSYSPHPALRIRIVCSAGTYIRVLGEDIGRALGTGAHLEELRRTRAGRFHLSRSVTLDRLTEMEDPSAALLPIDEAVAHLPEFIVPPGRVERTRNGLSSTYGGDAAEGQPFRMLDEHGNLLSVGRYDLGERSVKPSVVLI